METWNDEIIKILPSVRELNTNCFRIYLCLNELPELSSSEMNDAYCCVASFGVLFSSIDHSLLSQRLVFQKVSFSK